MNWGLGSELGSGVRAGVLVLNWSPGSELGSGVSVGSGSDSVTAYLSASFLKGSLEKVGNKICSPGCT